ADHPIFGVTPLGFQDQYAMLSKYHIAHAHNLFLAYLSEYGLIGALVFIMILAFCTVHFIRMMKYVRRRKHCTADLFLFALPVIPFMGTLDFPLFSQQVMLLTIALLSYWEVYLKAKAKAVRSYPLYS
ncbi:MAG TPA: O-antigen ligase domain-containing protein, partial [Bacillales bacterium]|nr:O-antigen ligase domain-containing protein [Bacillales bacterium]